MRIAICADVADELIQIQNIIQEYKSSSLIEHMDIFSFSSAKDLKRQMEKTRFDIYFLKVAANDGGGIKLGEEIRAKDDSGNIIFVAENENYAYKAFSIYAYQYFVRPLKPVKIYESLDRLLKHRGEKPDRKFSVKTKESAVTINYGEIAYIECRNHVLFFRLRDGSTVKSTHIRSSFEEATQIILQDKRFVHPHKSYIVNMDCISSISSLEFSLTNGQTVPIARKNYSAAKSQYITYLAK